GRHASMADLAADLADYLKTPAVRAEADTVAAGPALPAPAVVPAGKPPARGLAWWAWAGGFLLLVAGAAGGGAFYFPACLPACRPSPRAGRGRGRPPPPARPSRKARARPAWRSATRLWPSTSRSITGR